jgi:hypothetical protein
VDPEEDELLLCYCTNLTVGDLKAACQGDGWPPRGKERSGKLCTGCLGDLLHCLRRLEPDDPATA